MTAQETKRPYIKVFLFLALFTAIEVFVATWTIARFAQVILLLSLAAGKALLVAMYFMHLRYDDRRLLLIAFTPLLMAITLMVVLLPVVSFGS